MRRNRPLSTDTSDAYASDPAALLDAQCDGLRDEAARLLASTLDLLDAQTLRVLHEHRARGKTLCVLSDGANVGVCLLDRGEIACRLVTVTGSGEVHRFRVSDARH